MKREIRSIVILFLFFLRFISFLFKNFMQVWHTFWILLKLLFSFPFPSLFFQQNLVFSITFFLFNFFSPLYRISLLLVFFLSSPEMTPISQKNDLLIEIYLSIFYYYIYLIWYLSFHAILECHYFFFQFNPNVISVYRLFLPSGFFNSLTPISKYKNFTKI